MSKRGAGAQEHTLAAWGGGGWKIIQPRQKEGSLSYEP